MILLCIASSKKSQLTAMLHNKFIVLTGIMNALGYLLQFIGQKYTYASNASLFVNTIPIFTAISAHFLLNEHLDSKRISTILITFLGAGIIILSNSNMELTFSAIGDILCLIAGAVWGLYVTLSKKAVDNVSENIVLITAWFIIASIVGLPFAVFWWIESSTEILLEGWIIILYTKYNIYLCFL